MKDRIAAGDIEIRNSVVYLAEALAVPASASRSLSLTPYSLPRKK